jgi:hypothetical protein
MVGKTLDEKLRGQETGAAGHTGPRTFEVQHVLSLAPLATAKQRREYATEKRMQMSMFSTIYR